MLEAIIGGVIGVVLSELLRALGVPGEVRGNDAAIGDRDDSLADWVGDQNAVLRQECEGIRAAVGALPADLDDSERAKAVHNVDCRIAASREESLHQYRDEARRAGLRRDEILASEGWPHRVWRKLTNQPPRPLMTPDRAREILDAWRKPSQMGAKPVPVIDPSRRTLADAIKVMPVTGP